MPWILLVAAILTEVAGTLALRAAQDNPIFYAVTTAGYICAFWLLGAVLKRGMPLAVAYGIWGAAGVVLAAVMGYVLFGDALTAPMIVGIGLIVCGVGLVEFGRHVSPSTEAPTSPRTDAGTP